MSRYFARRRRFTAAPALIGFAVLVTSGALVAAPLPGQPIPDPDNPRRLIAAGTGAPFVLAGPGDPEDFLYRGERRADGTRDGDQAALIAKLAPTGANTIYMQVIRSHGGDGDDTHNPFVGNDPAQGLSEAVLAQWDGWFAAMDAAGIVIYLFLYDDSARIWPDTGADLSAQEIAFVDAVVARFSKYSHLVWAIAEEYEEAHSADRIRALAARVRAADPHDHIIAVHKLSGVDFAEFAWDPHIDQFAMQYNVDSAEALHDGVQLAGRRAARRYNVVLAESVGWGSGELARRKAWATAMAGAGVLAFEMDIAGTAVGDMRNLGRLRAFMEQIPLSQLAPRNDLAAGATRYVLSNPGRAWIAYADQRSNAPMGLRKLPARALRLTWYDIENDRYVEDTVAGRAGVAMWPVPDGFGEDVALYVRIHD